MAWKERVWKEKEEGHAVDLNNIETGINEARKQGILSPEPNGTDDTTALQAWLNECAGQRAVFRQAGGHPYKVKSPLDLPAESWVTSDNPYSVEIERIGNGDLFRCSGNSTIENIYVKAASPQAEGAAFDCSHHNCDQIVFRNLQLGSNFFNGFNLVAETGLSSFGPVFMTNIIFAEPGALVKGYGGAGVVSGSTAKRTVGLWMAQIYIGVLSVAEMPSALKIANTDSLHLSQILVQNAGTAFNFGEGDASALRSTNGMFKDLQADGCTLGFSLASLTERHTFSACTAEGCGTGAQMLEQVKGLKFVGGSLSANNGHGLVVNVAGPKAASSFIGTEFACNGQGGAAGAAGATVAASQGGLLFNGCTFGNAENVNAAKQKIGLAVGAKCENIGVYGCRFDANSVGVNYTNAEEAGSVGRHVPENVAALEANNLVA